MRVKLEWLNELIDLTGLSIEEIVNKVSLYSIEVEGVEELVHASHAVIGHVLTKVPHPDSDHLNCLTVDVKDEVLNIVCGAKNVEAGQYVIVAKEGCVLDGGTIKKSKIRGVESCGMVCSLQELGIEKKFIDEKFSQGIYYFEDPVEIGTKASKALNLDDPILTLGLTPNRGDMLSMIGVAYEFSAVFHRPLKPLTYELVRDLKTQEPKLNIQIETPACSAYYGQIIRDVVLGPSPRWLSSRLIAFGIRPINNCVDITNYIMALFGQPLHAFDLDKLGHTIVIRNAKEEEKFTTLDNQERILKAQDIVITDGKQPQCLGGVMGGLDSEITSSTKNIMLEAAVFDPMTIRKTAARLNLHSEASARYERNVDVNRTKFALDYACYLFQTLAQAHIVGEPSFVGCNHIPDREINVTTDQINHRLGTHITKDEMLHILAALSFKVETEKDILKVMVPNRRSDITIWEDLSEEIARLYGYDKLPSTLPIDDMKGELTTSQKNTRKIKQVLTGLGLNEVVSYSLVHEKDNEKFNILPSEQKENITLLMPLTEDHKVLRHSLLPSLLNVVQYHFSRKMKNIAIFELGKIYYKTSSLEQIENKKEKMYLSGALANQFSNTEWNGKVETVDFYLVKGILENLFSALKKQATFLPLEHLTNELHPKRSASIYVDGKEIGFVGQLHPKYALEESLENVYVFEIDIDSILQEAQPIHKYQSISKLPSVERDLALVMKKDVQAKEVIECIKKAEKQTLSDVQIFDLYEGAPLKEDEKSLAVKIMFTSNEPMTEEMIQNKIKKILKDLQFKLNITLRS